MTESLRALWGVWDKDDIDIRGDVMTSVVDGIPSIKFSETIHSLMIKSIEKMIILKLLGRKIDVVVLFSKLYSLWQSSHPIQLMDLGNDYFMFKFRSEDDYLTTLFERPWIIFGHYLTVKP